MENKIKEVTLKIKPDLPLAIQGDAIQIVFFSPAR